MIDNLLPIFKSMTKSLEILYVIEDLKPVSRILVDEEDLAEIRKILENHSLFSTISDFKIKKEVDENQYSNKGIRLDSKEKGQFFLYVSKDKDKSEKAKALESENNHKELGKLLGYPECCCRFFQENFPIESKRKNDYVLATLRNSEGFIFPFETNIAVRHMDLTLLSHYPCYFHCEESKRIANKHLACIKKHSEETAMIFEGMLKGAVLFTEDKGIFLLRDHILKDNKLSVGGIMGSRQSDVYEFLKKHETIEIINNMQIKAGTEKLDDVGIMVFI